MYATTKGCTKQILLLVGIVCGSAFADIRPDPEAVRRPGPNRERYDRFVFTNDAGESMPFMLMAPRMKAEQKYPLVIELHAGGKRLGKNGQQAGVVSWYLGSKVQRKTLRCFVLAPHSSTDWCAIPWGRTGRRRMPENAGDSLTRLYELVDELLKTHPIDPKRIYIAGSYMGGAGALETAARRPNLFAAVLAGHPETYEEAYALLKTVPVAIVPAAEKEPSRERHLEIADEFRDAGNGNVKILEGDAFTEAETYRWLSEQERP